MAPLRRGFFCSRLLRHRLCYTLGWFPTVHQRSVRNVDGPDLAPLALLRCGGFSLMASRCATNRQPPHFDAAGVPLGSGRSSLIILSECSCRQAHPPSVIRGPVLTQQQVLRALFFVGSYPLPCLLEDAA